MANESSQFYTCITHGTNSNNNEKIIKNHSLPINLTSGSFNSCLSFQINPRKDNDFDNKDDIVANMNQRECSELIVETQQKLQNLRLESCINSFPIDLYSKFAEDDKLKNKLHFNNYTEINNNDRKNNKRKLNSNPSSIINENDNSQNKQNSHEKISEVKKLKSSNNYTNNRDNINQINYSNEINENNINNAQNLNNDFNINSYEINKNNNINNANIINHNANENENVRLQRNEHKYKIDDDIDGKSDYKRLNNIMNNTDCWGILQSINPKFSTIYLNEINYKKECIIGRNRNCNIWINLPQISNHHCRIYYTESKSKITGYITREFFLQDLSTYGTFVNEKLVGKGKTVHLYNGQSIDLYKSRNKEKFYIFLIPNNGLVPDKAPEINYIINNDIGSGSFGRVCKGIRKNDNLEVAIKIVNKSKLNSKPGTNLMKYLEREVNILKSIQHKNIIQLYDVYEDSTNVYLVLELARGGELLNRIKLLHKLNENQTRIVMKQLFSALEYLHSQGIAHRDLKPENILMTSQDINDFSIKLSDFGLSRFVDDNFYMRTLCGTPNYTAPEVFDRNVKNYTIAVDMWSCGVIMYICLCGYPPFSKKLSKYPLKTQILNGFYTFKSEHWSNISIEAISLIKSLLQVRPENRINVSRALNHPFITYDENMQIEYELKRKRIQISKDEQSVLSNKSESELTDLDDYSSSNHKNSSNKLKKRQKLL